MLTFLVMGILLALVLALLIQPIISGKDRAAQGRGENNRAVDELSRKKRALIKEIKDIELDYEMGKIDKSDFDDLTKNYRQQAMLVIKEIDSKNGRQVKRKKASVNTEFVVPENEISGFCVECGSPLFNEAAFCGVCGHKI